MDKQRRHLLGQYASAAMLSAVGLPARAQALENAKIFVGFAAGGTVDVTARRLADKLRGVYAKNVVVENRTGAGGQLALAALKGSAADGASVVVTPMSMLGIYPATYKKLPYDPVADFIPVSMAVRFDFGFAVGPMVPAGVKTVPEFVAWCKANPKEASFGSPAAGSVPHFIGELFGSAAGIAEFRHVPYRGTQPAIADLMGGQVASVSGPIGEFLQHLPTGKVRLIATSGPVRNRFAPTTPTFVEQGLKDLVYDEWFGMFLPAKTPADVVKRLSDATRAALASPDVIEGLAQMGLEARGTTPDELALLLKKDTERWAPIVKRIGFTAES
jgi:tripartite-type tricarboxylate transporter receptor subunit TctC